MNIVSAHVVSVTVVMMVVVAVVVRGGAGGPARLYFTCYAY